LAACTAAASSLKPDEEVVFYTSFGWRTNDGWEIQIHGVIFEPEKRAASIAALRHALGLSGVKLNDAERDCFARNARLFLTDHERGKKFALRVGGREFQADKSSPDGGFSVTVRLTNEEVRKSAGINNRLLPVEVVLPGTDSRRFTGEIALIENRGLTVISDIDDTIKVTNVRNRKAMLRNTFLREFEAVPGMAGLYAEWAKAGTQVHYVSASPVQLYAPLAMFIQTNGFPRGVFHLKPFRWKDQSFFGLFADPQQYKIKTIEPLLTRFPQRRFVLVGDSGERDPEAYAALARKYPIQVVRIFIRDVTNENASAPRYEKVFRGLPPELWFIFREPTEIQNRLEPNGFE
jgi:hypothetical protein